MTTLKQLLKRLHQNLNTLLERKAKLGGEIDLKLENSIEEHQEAIGAVQEAISSTLTPAEFSHLKQRLATLTLAISPSVLENLIIYVRRPFEPGTIFVNAGYFVMGSTPGPDVDPIETPETELFLSAYEIGKYPVTNREYAQFIKQNKAHPAPAYWYLRRPPKDKLNHPVVDVS